MNEQEAIEKIKILKNIQPDKKWVISAKTQILESGSKDTSFGFFNWLLNPGFLVVSGLALVLLTGVFLYNNIASFQAVKLDAQSLETMITHLNLVQADLASAAADLEKVKNPEQVVQIQETVGLALESGKKVVSGVKKMVESKTGEKLVEEKSSEVLTALTEIEQALENVEETMLEKQKNLAWQLIEEWEQKSLTQEQAQVLQQAKEHYNNQEFDQALIKALEISQIR